MGLNNPSGSSLTKTLYAGSDCSGVDGAVNRTLTHSMTMGSSSMIFIGGRVMLFGGANDYTVSGAVITFLINIDDTDIIQVMS